MKSRDENRVNNMSIQIGNNNKINNSVITDSVKFATTENEIEQKNRKLNVKKPWIERHPYVSIILIPMLIGFIYLFSFWESIVLFIEELF